jgi:hypothetical protein
MQDLDKKLAEIESRHSTLSLQAAYIRLHTATRRGSDYVRILCEESESLGIGLDDDEFMTLVGNTEDKLNLSRLKYVVASKLTPASEVVTLVKGYFTGIGYGAFAQGIVDEYFHNHPRRLELSTQDGENDDDILGRTLIANRIEEDNFLNYVKQWEIYNTIFKDVQIKGEQK